MNFRKFSKSSLRWRYLQKCLIFMSKRRPKNSSWRPKEDVDDVFEPIDCKMFTRKQFKLKRIRESIPIAWELTMRARTTPISRWPENMLWIYKIIIHCSRIKFLQVKCAIDLSWTCVSFLSGAAARRNCDNAKLMIDPYQISSRADKGTQNVINYAHSWNLKFWTDSPQEIL